MEWKKRLCLDLLEKHNGNLQKLLNDYNLIKEGNIKSIKKNFSLNRNEEKQVSLNKNDEKEKYYYELEKKFKNKIIILKSYGMEKRVCLDLLEKHNGNLQKLLNDYNLLKEKKNERKVEEKIDNEKEFFQGRLIILKSYGFDEKNFKRIINQT